MLVERRGHSGSDCDIRIRVREIITNRIVNKDASIKLGGKCNPQLLQLEEVQLYLSA